jgi:hypothetical protein
MYAITFDSFQYDDEVINMGNERNFDTLQYANRLKAVGVPEKQAEVQAEVLAEIIDSKLATKYDLELVKSELKRDIKELELKIELSEERTHKNIARMGYKTIVILGGTLGSMITIGVAVLGFLIKVH